MTSRQRTWRTCALAAALTLLLGASGETQQRPDEPLRGSDPGTEARPARPVRPAVPPAGRTRRQRPPTILSAAAATGTEYVTFWSGDLRIFAREPGTSVELTDIDTGLPLSLADTRIIGTNVASNPFTLFAAADSFEGIGGLGGPFDEIRVRIEASDPVIVWTGSLNPDTRHPRTAPDETGANPWASYIPAFSDVAQTNGREVGRDFLGFTTRRLVIIARKDPATPTSITVDDRITNTDPDDDDDHSLSAADAVYADAEIEVFWLDGFEDDTVRVTSNVDATVMAGYGITVESDWTTTPPSYAAGDEGIELGTLFYAFVHRSLTVFPTQDDTHVTITDLSDGDDSTAVTFAEGDLVGDYEFYTPTLDSRLPLGNLVPRLAGPAVTVHDNAGNPFDDDIVKVESDKPVLVYVGPIASDPFDYADVAFSVPTGPDSQVIYCFAQNSGASNDLQIFGFDPDTTVNLTSLSYTLNFRDEMHHDFKIGPGVGGATGWREGVGLPDTDVWWGESIWAAEVLRIESNKPITVLNGDYDIPHFGAFIPFVIDNPTLVPVAVAIATPTAISPGDPVTLDGAGSFDQDTVLGGQPITYEWDFDIAVDSSGDGIPDNDIDSTDPVVVTNGYVAFGLHTARLTFSDDDGETDTDFVTIDVVNQAPVADAGGPYAVDEGAPLQLDGSGSSDPDGDPLTYAWDLDEDGAFDDSILVQPVHTWPDDGTYTVALEVSDGNLEDVDTALVTVNDLGPTAEFSWTPEPQAEGSAVTFQDLSTSSPDALVAWSWDFGGLGTSSDRNPDFAFGDDGAFLVTLTVTDDDGSTDTVAHTVTIFNVAPTVDAGAPETIDEGGSVTLSGSFQDPGFLDTHSIEWDFGDGTTAADTLTPTHAYGDDGAYTVTLTVVDDDGAAGSDTLTVTVRNLRPEITSFGPFDADEAAALELAAIATDAGSDDLTFTWTWDDGTPAEITTYFNDGTDPDPSPSPGGVFPFAVTDPRSHTWGDDGVFAVTLVVEDDDGGVASHSTHVSVANVAPEIGEIRAVSVVDLTLRVAGEKYHSVGIRLLEDGTEVASGAVTREPGSPDDQSETLAGLELDRTRGYVAVIDYLPNDPRENGNVFGANPVWIDLVFADGSETRLHHTFNVRKSLWQDDHWNHIDPWEVPLSPELAGQSITFRTTATDPGSDDLEFSWDFGDGATAGPTTYFNDGVGPDGFPSPEIRPMEATDSVEHGYAAPGPHTVTVTVTDDDGGTTSRTLELEGV